MLKTLTPCTLLFLVGFHCHAAAWSYAADQLPFKILHDDDNFYAQVQTLTPPDDVLREHRDLFDEHDLETSMFDDEGIASDTQPPLQKRYGRATLESLALLGLVASFYWGTQVAADSYHYDVSLATLKKKLAGETLLFDDDPINTSSFPGHPLSGSYYYLIARNHHLSRLEALVWSLGLSALNQFFIEFREVTALNDLVTSPVAGAPIGEAMYTLSRYLRCSPNKDTLISHMMAAILDPIAFVNSLMWHDTDYRFPEAETCHYTPMQSDVRLFTGVSVGYYEQTHRVNLGGIVGFMVNWVKVRTNQRQ